MTILKRLNIIILFRLSCSRNNKCYWGICWQHLKNILLYFLTIYFKYYIMTILKQCKLKSLNQVFTLKHYQILSKILLMRVKVILFFANKHFKYYLKPFLTRFLEKHQFNRFSIIYFIDKYVLHKSKMKTIKLCFDLTRSYNITIYI